MVYNVIQIEELIPTEYHAMKGIMMKINAASFHDNVLGSHQVELHDEY